MKICPTCKRECEDFCMCGKCASCDPKHFAPPNPPYNPADDPDTIENEIGWIAEHITEGEL